MTELSGEELDRAIAKVAGLVEGKQFGHLGNHHWDYDRNVCRRCRARGDSVRRDSRCVKPPPVYHESLDLLLPVVSGLDCKMRERVCEALVDRVWPHHTSALVSSLFERWLTDNPARLLAEALVEAVGEKE